VLRRNHDYCLTARTISNALSCAFVWTSPVRSSISVTQAIRQRHVPHRTHLEYEALASEQYFATVSEQKKTRMSGETTAMDCIVQGLEEKQVLSTKLSRAISRGKRILRARKALTHDRTPFVDPFTGERYSFLGVSLRSKFDGSGMINYQRQPMKVHTDATQQLLFVESIAYTCYSVAQCVCVLDVSGSMGARFRETRGGCTVRGASKIEMAKKSITNLIDSLLPDVRKFSMRDRLCLCFVVLRTRSR
jgi:hypothetical protein